MIVDQIRKEGLIWNIGVGIERMSREISSIGMVFECTKEGKDS